MARRRNPDYLWISSDIFTAGRRRAFAMRVLGYLLIALGVLAAVSGVAARRDPADTPAFRFGLALGGVVCCLSLVGAGWYFLRAADRARREPDPGRRDPSSPQTDYSDLPK
jgi:hypothetical protein